MKLPTHIKGSWQFSGHWLGSYRLIAENMELNPIAENRETTCPICEFPEVVHIVKEDKHYPLMYYCPECGSVYGWYVAKCPECNGYMWNKNASEGKVICTMCGREFDTESIQEINEDPDFGNEAGDDE